MYRENLTTACEACYGYILPACPASTASISIKGSLGNIQSRFWSVEDKFGKTYTGTSITLANGDILIPLTDFPEGYFTEYSGQFIIYFKATELSNDILDMTFSTVVYECIKLSFENIDSDNLIIQ